MERSFRQIKNVYEFTFVPVLSLHELNHYEKFKFLRPWNIWMMKSTPYFWLFQFHESGCKKQRSFSRASQNGRKRFHFTQRCRIKIFEDKGHFVAFRQILIQIKIDWLDFTMATIKTIHMSLFKFFILLFFFFFEYSPEQRLTYRMVRAQSV